MLLRALRPCPRPALVAGYPTGQVLNHEILSLTPSTYLLGPVDPQGKVEASTVGSLRQHVRLLRVLDRSV